MTARPAAPVETKSPVNDRFAAGQGLPISGCSRGGDDLADVPARFLHSDLGIPPRMPESRRGAPRQACSSPPNGSR